MGGFKLKELRCVQKEALTNQMPLSPVLFTFSELLLKVLGGPSPVLTAGSVARAKRMVPLLGACRAGGKTGIKQMIVLMNE